MIPILRNINGEILRVSGDYILRSSAGSPTHEIDDLVYNQGYVPVATASELKDLQTDGSRTMGTGTIWQGTYTTGLDKKYIQVKAIHTTTYTAPTSSFTGIYNGNTLAITGLTVYLFLETSSGAKLRNIRVIEADIQTVSGKAGLILRDAGQNTEIDNCIATGTITIAQSQSSAAVGGIVGSINSTGCSVKNSVANITIVNGGFQIGGIVGSNVNGSGLIIDNCHATTSIDASYNGIIAFGGIIGYVRANSTVITYSTASVSANFQTNGGDRYIGGIVGYQLGSSNPSSCKTEFCSADVSISADSNTTAYKSIGGIAGLNRNASQINNCYATGSISNTGSGTRLAGGIAPDNANSTITNCYAAFTSITAGTRVGLTNGGTITNSYYDKDLPGFTGGLGNARTTAQMKAGTASSFILPDGSIDPDSLAANAMYTSWDNAIWDFRTTNDYPILK